MDSYKVDLRDPKSSAVSRKFSLGDDFFSAVQAPQIHKGRLDVALTVNETSGTFLVEIDIQGTVEVECDRCMQPMNQEIHCQDSLKAKLGEAYEDDSETITVPEKDGILDLGWRIYETAALAIPLRHVHPDGACDTKVTAILNKESETRNKEIDPRWSALKKLKPEI